MRNKKLNTALHAQFLQLRLEQLVAGTLRLHEKMGKTEKSAQSNSVLLYHGMTPANQACERTLEKPLLKDSGLLKFGEVAYGHVHEAGLERGFQFL